MADIDALPLTLTAVKSLVFRLNKKRLELSCNKHGDQIVLLFQEPFFAQQSVPAAEHAQPSNDSAEVQQKVVVTAKPKLCVSFGKDCSDCLFVAINNTRNNMNDTYKS